MADGLSVLKHFGWAPQRFDSRKKPYARAALRLQQAFSSLAAEAEGHDPKRRDCALHLLNGLSGANSGRILLAGMLADLTWEFSKWVHVADEDDPDPFWVQRGCEQLFERLRILFTSGLILADENKESFTKECVRFLRKTKVLHCGKTVFTFSVGDLDDPATLSEPLTRMKVLVKALEKLLPAVRSPSSWLARFLAYQLPSPCSPGARRSFSHLEPRELQERERQVKDHLSLVWSRAGLAVEPCWREFLQLLPSAERHRAAGSTVKSAWALASADFPELRLARRFGFFLLVTATCKISFQHFKGMHI